MNEATRSVGIGIVGLGTVGGGVVRLIQKHHDDYVAAYGADLRIVRACALEQSRAEELGISAEAFTTDWHDVVSDPAVDIVIELIGGEHPATEIFESAFAAGKHVVTANKALLGRHVEALGAKAAAAGVQIRCEAAAGGGIPIVGTLEHDLVGNQVLTIAGIMNGTTNYILTRMSAEGLDYSDVLADAQRLGYAEADPTADVDGFDAASKIAILSSIGFRTRITTDDVYMQGIRDITSEDIAVARDIGYVIKLLAIARNTDEGVDVRVHPAMIPATHQLAAVNGAMNAVFVVGDAVGETMFYGAGAGSFPTASAVVGDVLSLSEHISRGTAPMAEPEPFGRNLSIRNIEDLSTNYYIRLKVADRVGALAETVDVFASKNISIKQVMQLDGGNEGSCSVVFLTHTCSERDVRAAIDALEGASCLQKIGSVIRIEDVDAWSDGVMDN
ncbi:homoserine dehydrogenase [Collinsella tanakaei]|uniref:homoserine dehydrogenase n=1 Tax=Collinsella tanakaei TaxID=626935 RepID=UPI0026EE3C10|nr:homoserine dehydrogenase [Collinsella tanakaei]